MLNNRMQESRKGGWPAIRVLLNASFHVPTTLKYRLGARPRRLSREAREIILCNILLRGTPSEESL